MPKVPGWSKVKENKWRNDNTGLVISITNFDKWYILTQGEGEKRIEMRIDGEKPWFKTLQDAKETAIYWMRKHPFTERVKYRGYLKKRWRCSKCYRGLIDGHCPVHIDVSDPVDLKKAIKQSNQKILKEVHSYTEKSREEDLVKEESD